VKSHAYVFIGKFDTLIANNGESSITMLESSFAACVAFGEMARFNILRMSHLESFAAR
jgi:hypothetical protein